MKRTEGISNPVDARRAEVERMCDEDHAKRGARLIEFMEERDRQRSLAGRIRAGLARLAGRR